MKSNSENKTSNGLVLLLIIVSIILTFIPLLNTIGYCLLLAGTTLVCVLSNTKVVSSKSFVYLLLFVFIQIIYSFAGKGIGVETMIFNAILFLFSITTCYNIQSFSKKQKNTLLVVLAVLFLYTNIATLFILLTNPLAVRMYGYGNVDSFDMAIAHSYRMSGMYSYAIGEAHAIILPAFLAFCMDKKRKFLHYTLIIIVVLGIIVQLMAALTTSFILSAMFCLIVLLSSVLVATQKNKMRNIIIILIMLIPAFLWIKPMLEYNIEYSKKIEDVNESLIGGQATGQVEGRNVLYIRSMKVCLRNPIFGWGDMLDSNRNYTENTVSGHTSIFDYWGLYGMFTLFLIFAWKDTIKSQLILLEKNRRKLYRWSAFSLLFLLLLKGPVTIGTNFIFSSVFLGILCVNETNEKNNKYEIVENK